MKLWRVYTKRAKSALKELCRVVDGISSDWNCSAAKFDWSENVKFHLQSAFVVEWNNLEDGVRTRLGLERLIDFTGWLEARLKEQEEMFLQV